MVRVLIVRHGETVENVQMGKALLAYSEGNADAVAAQQLMRSHYKTESASDAGSSRKSDVDSPLTEVGEDMAKRIARFYGPMLKDLAERGKLHAFCSPMCRNMQTADPLLTELGIKAEIRQDLKETGGLIAPEEMSGVVARITELANAGNTQGAHELLKNTTWAQLGMSGEQIMERFKWATLEEDFPKNQSTGAYDVPWHNTGIESDKTAQKRTVRVVEWLRDLSEKLPYDDLVLFISHGGALSLIFNHILANGDAGFSYGSFDNTSASGFILGKDPKDPETDKLLGPPPTTMFSPAETRNRGVKVQFLNRIDHLIWEPSMPNAEAHRDRMRGFIEHPFFPNPSTIATVQAANAKAKSRL